MLKQQFATHLTNNNTPHKLTALHYQVQAAYLQSKRCLRLYMSVQHDHQAHNLPLT